jgi:hypothetical protein
MKRGVILLASGLFLPPHSAALANGFGFAVTEGYAPISGYLQTPAGGNPGTSDRKRPTFKELGVDDATYTDVDLYYQRGPYVPYVAMRFLSADSSGILDENLTTQGQSFLKGEPYSQKTSFDIYRLGLKRDLTYFTPKIELAFMDFNYDFRTAGASAKRSYVKPAVRLGAEKSFNFDRLDVEIEASGSVPLSNTPDIYSVGVEVKYGIAEGLNVGVGVQYFYLDYEDNQDLPNHLRLEMKPALSLLLEYRF